MFSTLVCALLNDLVTCLCSYVLSRLHTCIAICRPARSAAALHSFMRQLQSCLSGGSKYRYCMAPAALPSAISIPISAWCFPLRTEERCRLAGRVRGTG